MKPENAPSKCIGLVGGLGVGAAIYYYRELAAHYEKQGRPMPLVMAHADVETASTHTRSGDMAGLAAYLAKHLGALKAAGADFGVIPALTPHGCIKELAPISPLPLINILQAVQEEINKQDLKRVAVFGTRYTMQTGLFGALPNTEIIQPTPEDFEYIHEAYWAMVVNGEGTQEHLDRLTKIAHNLINQGAQAILMAGTDFKVLFNRDNTRFPHIDCADVHIQAILAAAR
jgi:aspartate racemase